MSTSPKPLDDPVFFLDRTHGRKVLPQLLRAIGMNVEVHADHFKPEEADPVWIEECAKRGWVIITGDKRIEKVVYNRVAVQKSKAKVFILTDTNTKAEEWAAAIIVGRRKMIRLAKSNEGPFYATIGKVSEVHVSDIRIVMAGATAPVLRMRKAARKRKSKSGQPNAANKSTPLYQPKLFEE